LNIRSGPLPTFARFLLTAAGLSATAWPKRLSFAIRAVVDRISREPLSTPRVEQRPEIRVALLIRYPFKVFYRVLDDRVRIVHIRHAARRPWRGQD